MGNDSARMSPRHDLFDIFGENASVRAKVKSTTNHHRAARSILTAANRQTHVASTKSRKRAHTSDASAVSKNKCVISPTRRPITVDHAVGQPPARRSLAKKRSHRVRKPVNYSEVKATHKCKIAPRERGDSTGSSKGSEDEEINERPRKLRTTSTQHNPSNHSVVPCTVETSPSFRRITIKPLRYSARLHRREPTDDDVYERRHVKLERSERQLIRRDKQRQREAAMRERALLQAKGYTMDDLFQRVNGGANKEEDDTVRSMGKFEKIQMMASLPAKSVQTVGKEIREVVD